jgi:CheY-like chemotaxis protein
VPILADDPLVSGHSADADDIGIWPLRHEVRVPEQRGEPPAEGRKGVIVERLVSEEYDEVVDPGAPDFCKSGVVHGAADIDSPDLGAERPDLVLMDIRLRGMRNGIDAAREIRERFGIRSLFVTANSDPETQRQGGMADPAGWLQKPVSGEDLVASVVACLGRSN